MALVHTKLKLGGNCEIQLKSIGVNLIVICVKVVSSFGGPDDQYVCLYVLESKIGYMALKTTEQEISLIILRCGLLS